MMNLNNGVQAQGRRSSARRKAEMKTALAGLSESLSQVPGALGLS